MLVSSGMGSWSRTRSSERASASKVVSWTEGFGWGGMAIWIPWLGGGSSAGMVIAGGIPRPGW